MIPNAVELQKIARMALDACPAKEAGVWVRASSQHNLRFAGNGVTTSGSVDRVSVSVTAAYGQRAGTASTEDLGRDAIATVGRTASDLAKLVPPSPERMPLVGKQIYPRTFSYDAASAKSSAQSRANRAGAVLDVARAADLVAAGFLTDGESVSVFLNRAGASGTSRETLSELSVTMRSADGTRSGWAAQGSVRAAEIDAAALARRAAEKAQAWTDPGEVPAGRYTAILEPAAAASMLGYLVGALDRRPADEGRSAFAKAGGGTRIGETMFAPSLTLSSDPGDKKIPGSPFAEDGLAARRFVAIDKGRLSALPVSRHWAKEKKLTPTAEGRNWNLVSDAPVESLDALIASTEKGILVTRLWYVRMLAPQSITVTGLTRDATFLVESGKVTRALKNFRINQSVLDLFRDVEAAGPTQYVGGWGVPALKVKDLGFAGVSDAV